MANINRVRVALGGFPGAPGVSTFYATEVVALRAALNALYVGWCGSFPNVVTWTIETVGDIIDPLDGNLVGTWNDSTPFYGTGLGGTGAYAAPAGIVANWNTGSVLDGHRLTGRTFMVPIMPGTFQNDGTIDSTSLASLRALCTTFVGATAGNFVVWHRPRVTPARAGGYSVVTGSTVNDRVAVLRSRRD